MGQQFFRDVEWDVWHFLNPSQGVWFILQVDATEPTDLKLIYSSINEQQAKEQLEKFKKKWDHKYPTIADSWERNWLEIVPFLEYPDYIRKAIYTTNAIESANYSLRKIIKNRSVLKNDIAISKLLYLALKNIEKKWTMPIHKWKEALNQFAIIFAGRFPEDFQGKLAK